jgi:hypothetical protein
MAKQVKKAKAKAPVAKAKAIGLWAVTSDAKVIARQQDAVNKTTGTLKDQLAILAANCVLAMLENENATPMTRFAQSILDNKVVRADALVKWALALGPFRAVKEVVINAATGKEEKLDVFKKDKERFDVAKAEYEKDKDAYAKALVSKPFYDAIKQRDPFAGANFLADAFALVDKYKKLLDDADKADKVDDKGMDDVRNILLKFQRPEKVKKAKASAPKGDTIASATSTATH